MKSYEKLAFIYDKDWGHFSPEYLKIIDAVKKKFKFKPKTVLDIACGTGKLIGMLRARGLDVIGIDISPEMVKVAKKNFPKIKFYVQDMSKLKLKKKFNLILCSFDSLNYLKDTKQLRRTFRGISKYLNENGIFIFDFNTPHKYIARHKGAYIREIGNLKFKQICDYDRNKKIARTTFDFGKKGKETHRQRAFTKLEVTTELKKENFEIIDAYDSFDLNPPNKNSGRLFFVVKNKGNQNA